MRGTARSVLIGVIVMLAVAVSLAIGRGPQYPLRDKPFQDTHEDMPAMAAASERLETLNRPKVVQTEPIKPEPDPLLMVLSEPQPMRRRATPATDICTRHGRVKVWVSKYRWRCLK